MVLHILLADYLSGNSRFNHYKKGSPNGLPFFVKFCTESLEYNNTYYICNFNDICVSIFITFAARYCVVLFGVNKLLTLSLSILCQYYILSLLKIY